MYLTFFPRVIDNERSVPLRGQQFPGAKKLVNFPWVNDSLESRRENKLRVSGEGVRPYITALE